MAPFTKKQTELVAAYQASAHAVLCEDDPAHGPLELDIDGLRCPHCSYRQSWVPREAFER